MTPGLVYYHASEERLRYGQVELTLQYGGQVHPRLTGRVWATGWRRWYAGSEVDVSGDRHDWFLDAEVSVTLWEVVLHPLSLELFYEYESNWSNDPFEENQGQSAGFLFHWGF